MFSWVVHKGGWYGINGHWTAPNTKSCAPPTLYSSIHPHRCCPVSHPAYSLVITASPWCHWHIKATMLWCFLAPSCFPDLLQLHFKLESTILSGSILCQCSSHFSGIADWLMQNTGHNVVNFKRGVIVISLNMRIHRCTTRFPFVYSSQWGFR